MSAISRSVNYGYFIGIVAKTGTFVGYNGDKQTDSLVTYRDWLQARGGVSIYV